MSTSRKSLEISALVLVALNLRHPVTAVSPVLEAIRADLHLSRTVAGLLTTVPVLCMGLLAPFAAYLGARRGAEMMVLWGTVALGIATAARGFADVGILLTTAFLAGSAVALIGPLLGAFIKHHFAQQTVMITGVYTTALVAGAGLSAGLTAPIRDAFHSWRIALAGWAVIAALAAIVWWLMLRKSIASSPMRAPARPPAMPVRKLKAWLLMLLFGLQAQLFYCMVAWLAPMYIDLGWSEARAGGLLSGLMLTQLATMMGIAWAANRNQDRRLWLYICSLTSLIGVVGLTFAPLAATWLWIVTLGVGTGGLFPLVTALALDYGENPADAGAWTAMMLFGGYILSATGPFLGGMLRDATGSYVAVFAVMAVSCVIMLPLSYTMKPKRR
jgi:CP family cyanate transporter-like MFS transporter